MHRANNGIIFIHAINKIMMITIEDFYKQFPRSTANSTDFLFEENANSTFPMDGIYIGTLTSACGHQLPALIPIHKTNGLCFLSSPETEGTILNTIQMMSLRFICSVPPSKCKLILYDGQKLGQNLLYLAELDQQIIGNEIYTSCDQLKAKLKQIRKDITGRITHTLGSKFKEKTLVEYNAQAGIMSLPYFLVIISNFPYTLDRETANLLEEIIKNGSRVGVYVLMNIDTRYDLEISNSYSNVIDTKDFLNRIVESSMHIVYKYDRENRYYIKSSFDGKDVFESLFNPFSFSLEEALPHNIDKVKSYLQERINAEKSQQLDISYLFTSENFWTESSSDGICIPIGKDEKDRIVNFTLGHDSHHAKVGGMTGTGKSVVLHNIISNGAWLYSPDELQFILMDFKDGIGFKPYENLPHTRILSLDKQPSFAQNVLDYVLRESSKRNQVFSENGVDNFADYKSLNLSAMPRLLVVIDEFTSMYYGISSSEARTLNEKIDEITRTVRSTGINMIICTQGLNKLDVELSQFSLGIGLRFQSDRDKRFIAPNFQFPAGMKAGDAFYCEDDSAKRFRVAYMKNDRVNNRMMVDERIAQINEKSNVYSRFERFIYNGKEQVDFVAASSNKISIGLPILSHKPVEISFNNDNRSNLLVVGSSHEAASSIFYHTIKQLISDSSKKKIFILNKSSLQNALQEFEDSNNEGCIYTTEDTKITDTIESSVGTIIKRQNQKEHWNTDIYIFLYDSFNYGMGKRTESGKTTIENEYLMEILKNGPAKGIHLLVYSDSFKHYQSTFGYDSLNEWQVKIALTGDNTNKIFASRENYTDIKEDSPYAGIADFGKESKTIEFLTFKIQ